MSSDFYDPASSQAQEGLLVSIRADPTVQDGMVVTASACWLGQVILKSNSVHIWWQSCQTFHKWLMH
jgi:hypothetical protein